MHKTTDGQGYAQKADGTWVKFNRVSVEDWKRMAESVSTPEAADEFLKEALSTEAALKRLNDLSDEIGQELTF